eukprot:4062518-Prymnesium_polylepis.1
MPSDSQHELAAGKLGMQRRLSSAPPEPAGRGGTVTVKRCTPSCCVNVAGAAPPVQIRRVFRCTSSGRS